MSTAFRTALAATAILTANPAFAADVCSILQQQYLAVAANSGYPAAPSHSASDIAALNNSLQIAEASAQANHCGGGILGLFGPPPSPACPAINQQVNQLQAQVRQAYASNNVGAFGGLFSSFSQPQSPLDQARNQLAAYGCPIPGNGLGLGGYRTLCVRTCDGYYFPIEYGASQDRFQADSDTCQTMYGGAAQVQLFVMPTEGDVADAQPLDGGKTYSAQPYAFAYRTSLNSACVAQLQSNVNALAASAAQPVAASSPVAAAPINPVPIPRQRPDRFEDPETLANAAGDLHPQALPPAPAAAASLISGSGIRVVGASYYNQILDQQAQGGPRASVPVAASIPASTAPATAIATPSPATIAPAPANP